MSAGRELFAREGPETQMDEIAAHAGVGIGTVYRHFPTKEALLTEWSATLPGVRRDRKGRRGDPTRARRSRSVIFTSAEAVEGDSDFSSR